MTAIQNQSIALVTGANKGIGFQIAKDLAAHDFMVLIGSRNITRGEAAAEHIGPNARAVQIDVTDQASIDAAAEHIRTEFGRLDVLANNAGIWKPADSLEELVASGRPSVADLGEIRAAFETNVFGVFAVTQAMLPLLHKSPAGRIVNTSSIAASLGANADQDSPVRQISNAVYNPSKTALNAITQAFAIELEATPIKVNAACPGFVATNFNNYQGDRSVEQGAREPVRLALLGADGPTGTFSDENGPLPW